MIYYEGTKVEKILFGVHEVERVVYQGTLVYDVSSASASVSAASAGEAEASLSDEGQEEENSSTNT